MLVRLGDGLDKWVMGGLTHGRRAECLEDLKIIAFVVHRSKPRPRVAARWNPCRDDAWDEDQVGRHDDEPEEGQLEPVAGDACQGEGEGDLGPACCDSGQGDGCVLQQEKGALLVARPGADRDHAAYQGRCDQEDEL